MSIPAHAQETNEIVIEIDANRTKVTEAALKSEIFDVKFDTWEPNSLHWVAPSNMIIYSDGSWFIYAIHIANMRRTGGLFDVGQYRTWLVNVQYLNAQDSVVHASDYVLRGLDYKGEVDNATAQGVDRRLAEIEPQIIKARFTRIIR